MWILVLLFSFSFASAKEVKIAVQEHAGYSAKSDPGYLNEIISQYKKAGVKAKFVFLPLKRAVHGYYQQKKYDCFIGGDEEYLTFSGNEIEDKYFSRPHFTFLTRLFSASDLLCDLEDMSNKSLIVVGEFPYQKIFKSVKLSRVETAPNLDQAINMALHGRAYALISYVPTPNKGLLRLKYCPKLALTKNFSKTHCYKSESNLAVIKKIDETLLMLKENGKLSKILNSFYGEKLGKEIFQEL